MNDRNINRLAAAGVLAAAILLLTLVSIALPGGHGYVNLGDAGVLTAAYMLGGGWGVLCAGAASALADVILGWAAYAPASFLIKGLEALIAAALLRAFQRKPLIPFLIACLIVPAGYFAYEWILYGMATGLVNVLPNLAQGLLGACVARGVAAVLARTGLERKFRWVK